MKLDCDVIKDLYPLYEEDELSPKVKMAVETHLATCKECTNIYSNEIGFKELLKGSNEANEPSQGLDDKIRLRLKLRRITILALVLFTIIIVSIVKDYMTNRELLADAYNGIYQLSETYTEMASSVKGENVDHFDYYRDQLFPLLEEKQKYEDNLNFFERLSIKDSPYGLYLKQDQFIDMLTILHLRFNQGNWDKEDEKAFERLHQYLEAQHELVRFEYDKFHHGYSSYLEFTNTKKMAEIIEEINDLTYYYTRFHKLPEDMVQKGKSELTSVIQKTFNIKNGNVTFEESNPLNEQIGVYHFMITDKEKTISGKIDSFTGYIFEANHDSHSLTKGEMLDESKVKEKAVKFLEELYGVGNVEIKSEGMNVTISSNDDLKVYSFSFISKANGYLLHNPYETNYLIHFDARTGELFSFHAPSIISADFFKVENEVNFEKKQAIEIIENEGEESTYTYQGLGVIKSMNRGEFVLVHIFESKEGNENVYLNTESGDKEKPYIGLHEPAM
ncbi:MAG: anti-sigma factor [Bacillota bacterium]